MKKPSSKKVAFGIFLVLVFAMSLISTINANTPPVVRNQLEMNPPYENGTTDWSGYGDHYEYADFSLGAGGLYVYSWSKATKPLGTSPSNAWAAASLSSTFSIVHSSLYNVTLNFEYYGWIGVKKTTGTIGSASASASIQVTAHIYNDTGTIASNTETIFSTMTASPQFISGDIDVLLSAVNLTAGLEYSVRGEAYAYTYTSASSTWGTFTAEAVSDFWGYGYYVNLPSVRINDLNPDSVPPTTTATLSGTPGENGWYTSAVTVMLNATDNGQPAQNIYGNDFTNHTIDSGSWTLYSTPFNVISEGKHKVNFYSVDKAGNNETEKNVDVWIDQTPPSLTISSPTEGQTVTSSSVTVSWTGADAGGSGIDHYEVKLDSGSWIDKGTSTDHTFTGVSDGSHTVFVKTVDEAGNSKESSRSFSVSIPPPPDITPPTITHTPVSTANDGQAITITATITDNVAVTEAKLYYRKTGQIAYTSITMTKSGDTYTGTIPATVVTTAGVEYYIKATDGTNFSTHPATNPTTSPHNIVISAQNLLPTAVSLNNPSDINQNSMKLTWTQNTEGDFAKYEIYQSTSLGTLGTKIHTITDRMITSYVVTGLSADTTYYFTVRVIDSGNLYADSNQVSGKTPTADTTPPTVSVTMTPSSPDTTQTVNFTVTANDNTGGRGIKNITLYIDGNPVQTWTTAGTHNYTGGPYTQGTHTYYAQVFDNANNKGREPATGNREFTVSPPPTLPSWVLWVIGGIIAALVVATVTIVFWFRRKK